MTWWSPCNSGLSICLSHKALSPLNAELNPTCHLLALLGAHHILHVSRIRVKMVTCEVLDVMLMKILSLLVLCYGGDCCVHLYLQEVSEKTSTP